MNRREMLVVVEEVLVTGETGGERRKKAGEIRCSEEALLVLLLHPSGAGGCFSRISLSDSSVRKG